MRLPGRRRPVTVSRSATQPSLRARVQIRGSCAGGAGGSVSAPSGARGGHLLGVRGRCRRARPYSPVWVIGSSPCTSRTATGASIRRKQVPVGSGVLPVWDIIAAAPEALRVVELDGSRNRPARRGTRQPRVPAHRAGLIVAAPVGIGVIGAGTISDTYLENLTRLCRH